MNSVPFIPHHLFVAAAGRPSDNYSNPSAAQRGANNSAEAARPVPLEVVDRSQPLPASLLLAMTTARAGAS